VLLVPLDNKFLGVVYITDKLRVKNCIRSTVFRRGLDPVLLDQKGDKIPRKYCGRLIVSLGACARGLTADFYSI